jgi:uncharacterized membrane protein YfcA
VSPLDLAAWGAFGVFVGAYGTLVGAGGGFLVVPALLLGLGVKPEIAAGTSLVVVLFNASSGTLAYARRRLVDWRTALLFAAATVPGALLGPALVPLIPERVFQGGFGLLLIAVAGFLMLRPLPAPRKEKTHSGGSRLVRRSITEIDGTTHELAFNPVWGVALSFLVGFLSSILGIGGGVIHVPFLIYALGFPPHLAIATSQATLVVSAATGVVEHARLGHVLWGHALPLSLGAVIGAQLGAALSRRLKIPLVIRALALAIALVGLRCLWVGFSCP